MYIAAMITFQKIAYPVVNASSTGMNLVDNVAMYKFATNEPGIIYLKESNA